jgi:hypothetical protein
MAVVSIMLYLLFAGEVGDCEEESAELSGISNFVISKIHLRHLILSCTMTGDLESSFPKDVRKFVLQEKQTTM